MENGFFLKTAQPISNQQTVFPADDVLPFQNFQRITRIIVGPRGRCVFLHVRKSLQNR